MQDKVKNTLIAAAKTIMALAKSPSSSLTFNCLKFGSLQVAADLTTPEKESHRRMNSLFCLNIKAFTNKYIRLRNNVALSWSKGPKEIKIFKTR